MQEIIPCGLDFGNDRIKVWLQGKGASLPCAYGRKEPPQRTLPSGVFAELQAFPLLIGDKKIWFGLDVLGGQAIREMDEGKYDADHISVLFRAVLYKWGKAHNVDLASLGTLNVWASMPPGVYADRGKKALALKAYQVAFNRRQSHLQIRDGKTAKQVVTQFGGLQREAVSTVGKKTKDKTVLVVDIGGGTIEYVMYNGGAEPIFAKTDNSGMLHAFEQVNPLNPGLAELEYLSNKSKGLPEPVKIHFNTIKNRILMIKRRIPLDVDKIEFIGGGAEMMTPPIKATFKKLAPSVVIKRGAEYENARANWRAAGGE